MHTNHKHKSAQQQLIGQRVRDTDANVFFNLLTSDRWLDTVESLLPAHRERLFPPTETLSMFMAQALNADSSCQQAVDTVAVKRLASGVPPCSTHTSAYCRARMRLPADMVSTLALTVGQSIAADAPSSWHWRNRPVRLVDGTTVTLPDTDANQATYPQPLNQKPGLGFPLCRIVGLVCLGSGAVLNAAFSRYAGKGNDELSLLRTLLDTLARGDVLIGDALYATYFLLCQLQTRGVDAVFEQHGARRLTTDFRCGRRLGTRDHLIALRKPARRPSWMAQSDYDAAPDEITVRELRVGARDPSAVALARDKPSLDVDGVAVRAAAGAERGDGAVGRQLEDRVLADIGEQEAVVDPDRAFGEVEAALDERARLARAGERIAEADRRVTAALGRVGRRAALEHTGLEAGGADAPALARRGVRSRHAACLDDEEAAGAHQQHEDGPPALGHVVVSPRNV